MTADQVLLPQKKQRRKQRDDQKAYRSDQNYYC